MHVSGAGFAESRPDTPPGRLDFAHSAVTGRTLAYFTPDPLSQLLDRYARKGSIASDEREERALILLFSPLAASHAATGRVDMAQAARVADSSLRRLTCPDVRTAIALASEISPRVRGLRSEVLFAGASNASAAAHIFAPYEAVARQIDGFVSAAGRPPQDAHPSDVAAITAFCGVHLHPFLDGNGRWARVMAAQAAATAGSGASGAIAAAFQTQCKNLLTKSIWPHARTTGLSAYLAMNSLFEIHVREWLRSTATLELITRVATLAERYTNSRRVADKATIALLTPDNPDPVSSLPSDLNLTEKRKRSFTLQLNEIGREPAGPGKSILARISDTARDCIADAQALIQKELHNNG